LTPPTPPHPSLSTVSFSTPTPPPEIHTLSLHDALPISGTARAVATLASSSRACATSSSMSRVFPSPGSPSTITTCPRPLHARCQDRKSTRLNSSHLGISYAVFCLKKKKKNTHKHTHHLT